MRWIWLFLVWSVPLLGVNYAQTNDPTAGGAVKPVPAKKNPLANARTVNSGDSESGKTEDKEKVQSSVANPEEEQARSRIQPEDNSPDVGNVCGDGKQRLGLGESSQSEQTRVPAGDSGEGHGTDLQ